MYRLLALLLLVSCSSGNGGTKPTPQPQQYIAGRAPYALQNSNYDCSALIASLDGVSDVRYSWLYNTFDNKANGDYLECVYRLNGLKNTTMMEVHLVNEVCQRHSACGNYEVLAGLSVDKYRDLLKKKDSKLLAKLDSYFKTAAARILPTLRAEQRCFVSYGLESNLPASEYQLVASIGHKYFGPRCTPVWNPVGNNKFGKGPIAGYVHELHGASPSLAAPCIANLDGQDISFTSRPSTYSSNIKEADLPAYIKRYQHCEVPFLWMTEDNCKAGDSYSVDPRNRRGCPSTQIQNAVSPYLKLPK